MSSCSKDDRLLVRVQSARSLLYDLESTLDPHRAFMAEEIHAEFDTNKQSVFVLKREPGWQLTKCERVRAVLLIVSVVK